MRTQTENSLIRVYIDHPDHPGTSFEGIQCIREEVAQSNPESTELLAGLDTVLANPDDRNNTANRMRSEGRILLGTTYAQDRRPHQELDGLFYAEVSGYMEDIALPLPFFSVVKMGVWLSKARTSRADREGLVDDLIDEALYDVGQGDNARISVPVNRFTRLSPLHPDGSMPICGMEYREWKDLLAIGRLAVPDDLKKLLVGTAEQFHRAEARDEISLGYFKNLFDDEQAEAVYLRLLGQIEEGEVSGLSILAGETSAKMPLIRGSKALVDRWTDEFLGSMLN